MKGTSSTSCCLCVIGIAHGSHKGSDHLWGIHDRLSTGFFLGQLVHHHGRLTDNHLIFINQKLGEFWDSSGGQIGIILYENIPYCKLAEI